MNGIKKEEKKWLGFVALIVVGYILVTNSNVFDGKKEQECFPELVHVDGSLTPTLKIILHDTSSAETMTENFQGHEEFLVSDMNGNTIVNWHRHNTDMHISLGCGKVATILSCRGGIDAIGNCAPELQHEMKIVGNGQDTCISVNVAGEMTQKNCIIPHSEMR